MLYNAEVIYKLFYCSACTSKTDSTMKGTCYAQSECASRGGTSGGNCAAGKISEFLPKTFISPSTQCIRMALIMQAFFVSRLWSMLHVHVNIFKGFLRHFISLTFYYFLTHCKISSGFQPVDQLFLRLVIFINIK